MTNIRSEEEYIALLSELAIDQVAFCYTVNDGSGNPRNFALLRSQGRMIAVIDAPGYSMPDYITWTERRSRELRTANPVCPCCGQWNPEPIECRQIYFSRVRRFKAELNSALAEVGDRVYS